MLVSETFRLVWFEGTESKLTSVGRVGNKTRGRRVASHRDQAYANNGSVRSHGAQAGFNIDHDDAHDVRDLIHDNLALLLVLVIVCTADLIT